LIGKVALIIGGTNGIGKAIAKNLASQRCDVNIIGRSNAGNDVIDQLYQLHPNGNHSFIQADVSKMENIRSLDTSKSINKINYLIQTQGTASIKRITTSDGLDIKMSLHYYSRMFCIMKFLPNLLSHNEEKVVLSVLSGGIHSSYNKFDDIDLKDDSNYSISNVANAAGFYNDLALHKLSKLHNNVSFQHAAPGFVNTNWGADFPSYLLIPLRFIQSNFAMTPQKCATTMVDAMLQRKRPGFYIFSQYGQEAKTTTQHNEQLMEQLWSHTKKVLNI